MLNTEDRASCGPECYLMIWAGFNLKSRRPLRNQLKQALARVTLPNELEEHPSILIYSWVFNNISCFWSESQAKEGSWLVSQASAGCKDTLKPFQKYCTLPPDQGNPTQFAFFCVMSQTVKTNMSIIPISRESRSPQRGVNASFDSQCHPHSFGCHFKVSLKMGWLSDMRGSFQVFTQYDLSVCVNSGAIFRHAHISLWIGSYSFGNGGYGGN